MGFVSQLVTLIWLIVEQSAVEQPVQTRLGLSGVPGTGRAGPGERSRASRARDELGMPRGRAWLPHLHICNPWMHPKAADPKAWGLELSRLEGWSVWEVL